MEVMEQDASILMEDILQFLDGSEDITLIKPALIQSFQRNLELSNALELDIQSISQGCEAIHAELSSLKNERKWDTRLTLSCSVCSKEFKEGSGVVVFPCGHKRHLKCEVGGKKVYCHLCDWRGFCVSADIFAGVSVDEVKRWDISNT